jgi:RNA polymerase sigma-70 factor (ECF subfamily)
MRTDEELVDEVRRGEARAFDELYRRYHRRLFGYILRLVRDRDIAEDLFQEVILTVLRDDAVELRAGQFGGWLFTVARNRCLTHLRSADRREGKLRELAARGPSEPEPSPEELTVRRQELQAVHAALASLSEPHQDALMLKQVGRLTYRQIADLQSVPEGTAKSRLHFAIKAVRRMLGG